MANKCNHRGKSTLGFESAAAMCRFHDIDRTTWVKISKCFPDLTDLQRLTICKNRRAIGRYAAGTIKGWHVGHRTAEDLCKTHGWNVKVWKAILADFPKRSREELFVHMCRRTTPEEGARWWSTEEIYGGENNSPDVKPIKRGFYLFEIPASESRETNY